MLLSFLAFTFNSFSQGGPKWQTSGNTLSTGDWIGSENFQPIIFKSNGQERFVINADGKIVFTAFSGLGSTGLFTYDLSGGLIGIPFTGIPSQVLTSNGTFANISALTGWSLVSGTLITTNKVGIGVTAPGEALEINGNVIANGNVNAQQFIAGDVVNSGKQLRIASSLCMKGFDASIPGSRSEVCALGHDFFIQSTSALNNHTILNYSNAGNVLIGTDHGTSKLTVVGNTTLDGNLNVSGDAFYTGKSHFARITAMPGDSLIRFGDSTVFLNDVFNNLYASGASFTTYKGIGIGANNARAKGLAATALGLAVFADANYTHVTGRALRANAIDAHVIGTGLSGSFLTNSTANSLMIGFNSNIPTVFVAPAMGAGTTGQVGIGTTCIPTDTKLAVEGLIRARKVVVETNDWCDYVFAKGYQIFPLNELDCYLKEQKHIPNFKAEEYFITNGVDLVEAQKATLKTLEEYALYFVELKMENELMKEEIKELKKRLTDK